MKKLGLLFLCICILHPDTSHAVAGINLSQSSDITSNAFKPIDTQPSTNTIDTKCATKVFADALSANVSQIQETAHETDIRQWVYSAFAQPDVLTQVLSCPEIASAPAEETIKFIPIEYTFPAGRKIVINYETSPKILHQRLTIGGKRALPSDDPNPRIGTDADNTVWTNTDPAWYGIMVVQSGTLREFAGDGKNNTISIRYINDNIDSLYPSGFMCTSKSAIVGNTDELHQVVKKSVNIEDDTNEYYVAGDINLQWISYAEIALDIAITVATLGGGAVILGTTKAARASKALKTLTTTMRTLRKTESVQEYIRLGQKYARATDELKKIDRAKDAAAYANKSDEIKQLGESLRALEQTDDNVKRYRQAAETFTDLNKYRRNLRSMKLPKQRGNIVARTWRSFKAANTGGKLLNRGTRVARSGVTSGKVRDWLFYSTLANAGKLARLEEGGGLLYGAINFIGDMYDRTDTSTGKFTNNIEFKPLLLLSADDLTGQENVVNYGMWLMWVGDSVSPADDDAAYLQAMDFAEKVWQDFLTYQDETGNHYCDIDIYVVRPIIRNPGTDDAELYYLIMNDEPWTTSRDDK